MKKVFYIFLFCTITSIPHSLFAITLATKCNAANGTENADKNCPAGCGYTEEGHLCKQCETNSFSAIDNSPCLACPSNSTSLAGSTSCTCGNKPDVANGTWTPDSTTTTGNACTYTNINNLTCDNSTSYCADGYHKDTTTQTCEPNRQTCTDAENHIQAGVQYYESSTGTYSSCHAKECANGYFLNTNIEPKCGADGPLYDTCEDRILCEQDLRNCKNPTTADGISGDVIANGTSKDYSACECKDEIEQNIENGKATYVCKYADGNGLTTRWGDCTTDEVISCNFGYCEYDDSKKCTETKKGYYSPGTDKVCHPCPAGATTAGKKSGRATECHISNTTKFKDNLSTGGGFTLPINAIMWTN